MAKVCRLTMIFICVTGIYDVIGRRKRDKDGIKFADCANSADPDGMPPYATFHLCLNCFPKDLLPKNKRDVCKMVLYCHSESLLSVFKVDSHYCAYSDRMVGAGLVEETIGMDPDRPLWFSEFRASPVPIVTPGTLYVSFKGNITSDLPRTVSIELRVVKYFIGIPFPLPCFDGTLGSCLYEHICDNLQRFEVLGCPKQLKQYGLQCHCPFRSGDFHVRNLPLNIPKIHGFAGAFIRVRGDYGLTLRVLDYEEGYRDLGCLQLNFSMKKRYRGWLFKI